MSKFVERSISVILILTMLFYVFAINSFGAETEEDYGIMPCFTTINSVTTSFSISGINSTSSVALTSQYSTSLSIKVELQKLKSGAFETIETWTETGTGRYLSLEEDRLINVLCDYRIKVTCKADAETFVRYDYP